MLDRPTFVHLKTSAMELSKSVSAGGNNGLLDSSNPGLDDSEIKQRLVYDLSILKQCLKFEKQGKEFATATI